MKPYWTFGESRRNAFSLDEFLAQKEAAGVEFFHGKAPWLDGLQKGTLETFFRVCTEEMDNLSQKGHQTRYRVLPGNPRACTAKIQGNRR
jgi:hypothetical protein